MQISQRGIDFIKQFEGWSDTPYKDGPGYSIGYGHLIKAGESYSQITRAQGEELLHRDVQSAVDLVNRVVKVPLTQAQFDALVSLAYNWGDFPRSVALQRLNAGNYAGAAQRISEHPVTSNGQVLPGLVRRRKAEAQLFNSEGGGGSFDLSPGDDDDVNWWLLGGVGLFALILVLRR